MLAFLTRSMGSTTGMGRHGDRARRVGAAAGVGRWVRTGQDAVADLAVTVLDDYQGRGWRLLLDVAVLDAFACGVERFEGVVLGENIASRGCWQGAAPGSDPTVAESWPSRSSCAEGGAAAQFALPVVVATESCQSGAPGLAS